jgi:hypothetical protein
MNNIITTIRNQQKTKQDNVNHETNKNNNNNTSDNNIYIYIHIILLYNNDDKIIIVSTFMHILHIDIHSALILPVSQWRQVAPRVPYTLSCSLEYNRRPSRLSAGYDPWSRLVINMENSSIWMWVKMEDLGDHRC